MIASVTEPDLGLKIPDALIHHSPKNKVLEKCFIFTFLIKFCDLSVSSKLASVTTVHKKNIHATKKQLS